MLFYLAFLPTFVDLTTLNSAGVALVIILNFSALMAGLLLVAYGAGKASQVFSQHNAVRRLNQLTAVLMAAAGFLVLTH
jgi:threonine/homoserine/homoserine lactone efflux protein